MRDDAISRRRSREQATSSTHEVRSDVVSERELPEVGFDDFSGSSKTDGGIPEREGEEDQLRVSRNASTQERNDQLTSPEFAFRGTHSLEADRSWCRRRFQY